MATYTSKLNLKKPLGTEHVSRSDMNDNYDKIDAGVVTNVNGEISNSLLIGTRKSGTSVGAKSYAQGEDIEASGYEAHAEGYKTTASSNYTHAEGAETTASGFYAHAEGNLSNASGHGSHAEGYKAEASGNYTHAEGSNSKATGLYSHAEGDGSHATGQSAHSEGALTTASGNDSHSEGVETTASGNYSHAEGNHTIASKKSQHVSGEYNVEDPSGDSSTRGTYAEIIGNGTNSNAKSNARALDWNGNEYLKGDLYVGCNADSTGGTKISDAFTGATSSVAGSVGLVPAPSAGDQTKFLCADGTWGSVAGASDMTGATSSTHGVHGLVPAPAAGDQTKFLSGAGTWEPVGGASDMTGATASTAGVHGLVPAPAAGDQNKVLTGAGTWAALCLKGSLTAISGNGTTTITLTGLTAAHKVVNWGLFADSAATTPISPTDAPADIMITEGTDSYSITIANFGSAFWIQPVFILPQN